MSDSLRDQLLGLGFKPAPKPERPERKGEDRRGGKPGGRSDGKPEGRPHARADGPARGDARPGAGKPGAGAKPGAPGARPGQGRPGGGKPGERGRGRPGAGGRAPTREDIDLAKAYAIRAQREKDERIAAEKAKQEEARLRREARAKLAELLKDQALNVADADIARHFPYGGKIKRVYVTAEQLKQLNAGELGVLQQEGRYLLVSAAMLAQAEEIFAPAVALKVDPNAPAQDDPYADPMYQVPDDLVW
ncbi:uncharacterized protein YaiL (DUF2058 family) [Lysobacter enzymogenes]|jgi:uncharacterized protein YaiL (DUF2058 family)|uniref:DUF2058 domain-containing protein n=1 Tax=Lysobacter enzymogenes TaxID=69 RepID=UPI0008981A66|nr:DUF2058 family protein [Lysobacter enzymogenes]SDX62234.1 Uncharacterized conserved protein YaiL, DUF2058 family [Lysobacter enzymogenes]